MGTGSREVHSLRGELDQLKARISQIADREAISALLYEFAYLLDTKQFRRQAQLYADGATLTLGHAGVSVTKEQLLEGDGASLRYFRLTQHVSTNHRIEIDGDTARSRSYMLAVHMYDEPFEHADVGGYYDCEFARSNRSWRFSRVSVMVNWARGRPLPSHAERAANPRG